MRSFSNQKIIPSWLGWPSVSILFLCAFFFAVPMAKAVWAHDPPCKEARLEVNARLDDLKNCLAVIGTEGTDGMDRPLCKEQLDGSVDAEKIYNVCLRHKNISIK